MADRYVHAASCLVLSIESASKGCQLRQARWRNYNVARRRLAFGACAGGTKGGSSNCDITLAAPTPSCGAIFVSPHILFPRYRFLFPAILAIVLAILAIVLACRYFRVIVPAWAQPGFEPALPVP